MAQQKRIFSKEKKRKEEKRGKRSKREKKGKKTGFQTEFQLAKTLFLFAEQKKRRNVARLDLDLDYIFFVGLEDRTRKRHCCQMVAQ